MFKKTIKIVAIIAVTLIIFRIGQALAFIERGYMAYGGECLLLLLPIIIKIVIDEIKDFPNAFNEKERNVNGEHYS